MSEAENPVPIPAATIVIARDGANGMEVFMVKRHHQIDFVAGALVFPGGKVAKGDRDPALGDFMDGAVALAAGLQPLAAAAIREAFEESGILFARSAGEETLISPERLERLEHYRPGLEKGEVALLDMLRAENLRLACDRLAHFAHWITPENMPKRFDTHFFLAAAPSGHLGRHDGRESVDSIWIDPAQAVADRKRWNVIFPTKLNLMKLERSSSVDAALATARSTPPVTVMPWIEEAAEGALLRIRDDAGYEQTSALLRESV